jgi:quinol monooxygenase YgiN
MAASKIVLALWKRTGPSAEALVAESLALERKAQLASEVQQFEFYASADEPDQYMLYSQVSDEPAEESFIPCATDAQLSEWHNVGSFRGVDASEEQFGYTAGHVVLVDFRLKPGVLQELLADCKADIENTQGVYRFDISLSTRDSLQGLICTRWADRSLWEGHNAGPDYVAMAQRMGARYDGPPKRTLWKPVVAVPSHG